jgi:TolB-like protein
LTQANSYTDIPASAIHKQLVRILQSPVFVQSERLSRFLRFTVETVLSDQPETLKEYVIGTEVYDRKPPYHPSQDSIVRTEARRLRGKLKEYYESEGSADLVLIYFRPGSYAPVFRLRETSAQEPPALDSFDGNLLVEGKGISIAVIPFQDISGQPASSTCAVAITDELIHELMRTEGCRVTSANFAKPLEQYGADLPELAKKLGVHVFFEGTVRQEGRHLRVTARIITADGFQLWSQRFEAEPEAGELFDISEQMARSLINRTRPELSSIRKLKASAGSDIWNLYPALLRAEALVDEGTPADVELAISQFEQIWQASPYFPRPLCNIAQCYYQLAVRGVGVSAAAISEARQKAQRACELDPEMIQCQGCLAALLSLEWNWSEAEKTFKRALRLGAHAVTYRQYALFMGVQGRFDECCHFLQKAEYLDPFSQRQRLAWARFVHISRRYREVDLYFPERSMHGSLPLEVRLQLAFVYLELERFEQAGRIAHEVRRHCGGQLAITAALAEVLARCAEMSSALELVNSFKLLSPIEGISRFRQASLAFALGDEAGALALLSTAHKERDPELIWLRVDPRFDVLRANRQFADASSFLTVI